MGRTVVLILICLAAVNAKAQTFDHGSWNALLQSHVRPIDGGRGSQVDYGGFAEQRSALQGYLQRLSAVRAEEFDAWANAEQLAFLLNAYNAWTIELILNRYPDLQSIKDLGNLFQSPWKIKFIPLLEGTRSLDDIEHDLIRGSERYNDPRIHFAANCASIGCPALSREAYRGADLEKQLEAATILFLQDRSRNRLKGRVLEVSAIFKWYPEDFSRRWRSFSSVAGFLAGYAHALGLSEEESKDLAAGKIQITYLPYDWRLNSIR